MNLIYEINEYMSFKDLIHIWRLISKFKNFKIDLYIFFKKEYNHFFLTSLLRKIDWMVENQKYVIEVKVVTKFEYASIKSNINETNSLTLYCSNLMFLTNQPLNYSDISKLCLDSVNNNFEGDMYGIIKSANDIKLATQRSPKIWIFDESMTDHEYYKGWINQLKQMYLAGEELFNEYRS